MALDEREEPGFPDEVLTLIRKAQSSDPDAAEAETELVRRYLPLVRSLARPLYLAGWEAEDFLQEGTLGLIKAIRTYDSARSPYFGAYAKTCVYRKLCQAVERNSRKKNVPEEDLLPLDESSETLSDPTELPIDEIVIYRDEMERLVAEIRKTLSPFEDRVLTSYLEGYSFDEMAVRLKSGKKAVQNAMYRIRTKSEKIRPAP
ncbi:MAG: sigma-70 family RNA polymerase sigma factor [Clostridia bacterium]|nr:sigma-70 family RNA polymerase sigma factor [Clostridia bacterium]